MSAKKFRGWCSNGCGDLIKIGATKFCSPKCQRNFRFRTRVEQLEAGDYFALQITPFLRKYLTQRLGERCARCGWSERHPLTQKVPIEVEHIDGNWKNYHLDNLTLLCPNCHSLTPTFRGLNRGRGRAHRLGGRGNAIGSPSSLSAAATARVSPAQKVFAESPLQLPLLPPT
jgi:hypothetical protein